MATPFECEIVTPEKSVFRGTVFSLVCPGTNGYFGILARHAPLIARTNGGRLKLADENGERFFKIGSGLIEAFQNRVLILTRSLETFQNTPSQ